MMLAQLQPIPWPAIGSWVLGLLGVLAVVALVLHVVKLLREAFGHRPPLDSQMQKVVVKLEDMEKELKLDGSRRSKTLFDHIKTELMPVHNRLNEHDKQIARLEERVPRRNHH